MAEIKRLSRRGEAIKGALVSHIAPRLAADSPLKPGEIDQIILACDVATYKKQRPIIAKGFMDAFLPRVVAKDDLDPDTVKELLLALAQGSSPSDDGDDPDDPTLEQDDDSAVEPVPGDPDNANGQQSVAGGAVPQLTPEDHGKKLSDLIASSGLSPEDMQEANAHLQALAKPSAPAKNAPPKPNKEASVEPEKKPDFMTKGAMDEALAQLKKDTLADAAARFEACKAVQPLIGDVNPMLFDSADDIFKKALETAGVSTEGVHPTAFKSLVAMHLKSAGQPVRESRVVGDAAVAKTLNEKFPHAPKLG